MNHFSPLSFVLGHIVKDGGGNKQFKCLGSMFLENQMIYEYVTQNLHWMNGMINEDVSHKIKLDGWDIKKIFPLSKRLLVFQDKGVWPVTS